MNKIKETSIGVVTINYTKTGEVKSSNFTPTLKVEATDEIIEELKKMSKADDADIVVNQAGLVMASFFSKMNEFELADRNKYEIVGKTIECVKYSKSEVKEKIQLIKKCVIEFIFKPIKISNEENTPVN